MISKMTAVTAELKQSDDIRSSFCSKDLNIAVTACSVMNCVDSVSANVKRYTTKTVFGNRIEFRCLFVLYITGFVSFVLSYLYCLLQFVVSRELLLIKRSNTHLPMSVLLSVD